MNLKLFISYRRNDRPDATGRIDDYLVKTFGRPHVFKDVDSIAYGVDFRDSLSRAVGGCDVLLVVVGPDWVRATDEAGGRRLDSEGDYVRIEIETALRRGIPVIPLLLDETPVLRPEQLPESIRGLAFRHAARVRRDPHFHADIERVVKSITATAQPAASARSPAAAQPLAVVPGETGLSRRRGSRAPLVALAVALAIGSLGVFAYTAYNRPGRPGKSPQLETIRRSVEVRASVSDKVVDRLPDGRPRYNYRIWIEAPPATLDRIEQVFYNYNNRNFDRPRTVSTDRRNNFSDGYLGYGSVDGDTFVTLVLKTGEVITFNFNMYKYLHKPR